MFASIGLSAELLVSRLKTGPPVDMNSEVINRVVKDLKEVKKTWEWIEAVLADAEAREIRDKSVGLWLRDLKDLADRILDLHDVYEYDLVEREVEGLKTTTWFSMFIGWSMEIVKKIADDVRNIKGDLHNIAKRWGALHLIEGEGRWVVDSDLDRPPRGFLPTDPVFIGREKELRDLKELLQGDDGSDRDVEVIALIGMAGVGKTTLAQHTYSESLETGLFKFKGWISVPRDFDVKHLSMSLIQSLFGKRTSASEFSVLQAEVCAYLKGEKILLVLDDVWNEDAEKWASFVAPIIQWAGKGSKILITTRLPRVAETAGVLKSIHLSPLPENDGWGLLRKHAFRNQEDSAVHISPEIERIGKAIVKKCGALPLAVKVLGSLLRSKGYDEDSWREILNSSLLEFHEINEARHVLGSLYLSYLHLSPQLKNCFRFCSTYSRNRIIGYRDRDTIGCQIKKFWMAYNIVKDDREAENCLKELEARSFLKLENGVILMHDLLQDLSRYVLWEENGAMCRHGNLGFFGTRFAKFIGSPGNEICECTSRPNNSSSSSSSSSSYNICSVRQSLRALYIWRAFPSGRTCDPESMAEILGGLKFLRILSISDAHMIDCPPAQIFHLYNLRYLDLSRCNLSSIPDCVSNLKRLRWLDLSFSEVRSLPETVSLLANLQELNLQGCPIKELPEGIVNITTLQSLNLRSTLISQMPGRFGKLTNLQYLTDFVCSSSADDKHKSGLAELKNMVNLKDMIVISRIGYLESELDTIDVEMATKRHIRKLVLSWGFCPSSSICFHRNWNPTSDYFLKENYCMLRSYRANASAGWEHVPRNNCNHKDWEILLHLRPHRSIEEVCVDGYRGSTLPSWMGDECFAKLVLLQLSDIYYCKSLTPVHQLPSLEILEIKCMDSLTELVPKRTVHSLECEQMKWSTPFPKLEELYIDYCNELLELSLCDLACLKEVEVSHCSSLEVIVPPHDSVPSLVSVSIRDCPRFRRTDEPTRPTRWSLHVSNHGAERNVLTGRSHYDNPSEASSSSMSTGHPSPPARTESAPERTPPKLRPARKTQVHQSRVRINPVVNISQPCPAPFSSTMGAGVRMTPKEQAQRERAEQNHVPFHRVPVEKPPFTLNNLKKAIPSHCLQRSIPRSFSYVFADLTLVFLLLYVALSYIPLLPSPYHLLAWPLYWAFQGCIMTVVWVLTHQCGHHAFSDYSLLNDIVGLVLQSALLVPYFFWKYSHRRRHHSNTGSMDRDEVLVSKPKSKVRWHTKYLNNPPGRILINLVQLTLGWSLYLAFNVSGRYYDRFACHFDPYGPIYTDRDRAQIFISDVGILVAFYGLYRLAVQFSFWWVIRVYGVPILITNGFLVLITYPSTATRVSPTTNHSSGTGSEAPSPPWTATTAS